MWFAALRAPGVEPWLELFVHRLLEGSRDVLRLVRVNPFPDAPPRYLRATLHDYHFTTFAQRRATGAWWRREPLGTLIAPVSLARQPRA
jgi:hypothetical protein